MRRLFLGNPFLLLAIASYLFVQVWFMAMFEVREPLVARAGSSSSASKRVNSRRPFGVANTRRWSLATNR